MGACPQRSRALAGPEKPGARKPRLLHRLAQQSRIPLVRDYAALAAAVSGQAQAMLLNYEKELTDQFGIASSLATRLRFPVFIGSFTGEGEKALLQLRKRLPASLGARLARASSSPNITRSWVRPLQMTPAMNSGYESSRSLPPRTRTLSRSSSLATTI
jgi:hypothetical protein